LRLILSTVRIPLTSPFSLCPNLFVSRSFGSFSCYAGEFAAACGTVPAAGSCLAPASLPDLILSIRSRSDGGKSLIPFRPARSNPHRWCLIRRFWIHRTPSADRTTKEPLHFFVFTVGVLRSGLKRIFNYFNSKSISIYLQNCHCFVLAIKSPF
jgi:hypothetical protein